MANFSTGNKIHYNGVSDYLLSQNNCEWWVHEYDENLDQYTLCFDHENESPGCRSFTANVLYVDVCCSLIS